MIQKRVVKLFKSFRTEIYHSFVLYLQVNLLRYKRLISKSSDPEGLTRELRVCTEIICYIYQQETASLTGYLALAG